MNESGVEMGEEHRCDADHKQPAYKAEESNKTLHVFDSQESLKRAEKVTVTDVLLMKRYKY